MFEKASFIPDYRDGVIATSSLPTSITYRVHTHLQNLSGRGGMVVRRNANKQEEGGEANGKNVEESEVCHLQEGN